MTDAFNRSPEELVAAGIQSPSWEKYDHHTFKRDDFIPVLVDEPMPPRKSDAKGVPQHYTLITQTGERLTGFAQYGNPQSGIPDRWTIIEQTPYNIDHATVLAWKECPRKPKPQRSRRLPSGN
jgi:hypothetical protein